MKTINLGGKSAAHAAGYYDGRHGNPPVSDHPEYMAGFELGRHLQGNHENPSQGQPGWFRALPYWVLPVLLVAAAILMIAARPNGAHRPDGSVWCIFLGKCVQ